VHDLDQSTLDTSKSRSLPLRDRYLGLAILCHPDVSRIGEVARLFDFGVPGQACLSRSEPLFRTRQGARTAALASARVSRLSVELALEASGCVRIRASREAQLFVDEDRLEDGCTCGPAELERGVLLRLGHYVLLRLGLFDGAAPAPPLPGLIGESAAMQRLRGDVLRVAELNDAVLIRGESGSGKELVATALHELGGRRHGPYVAVNMAAIPASTAASELFGHGRGSFTGATSKSGGYFAAADGGTLFLDEFGQTAAEVQPMLLRAIESAEIQPLGGDIRPVDVRFVAATDTDLERAVELGSFHEPLRRRFGYELWLPPLRERCEDVAELFFFFLERNLCELGSTQLRRSSDKAPFLPAHFIARLVRHGWPGNVRELRQLARRFAILNRDRERALIDEQQLSPVRDAPPVAAKPVERAAEKPRAAELNDAQIAAALSDNSFSVNLAARQLGVSQSWLHTRMREIPGVRKASDLTQAEVQAALTRHPGRIEDAAAELRVSPHGLLLQMNRLRITRE
jgi:two-component system nitrogen regulation response regulator GlnG